MNAVPNLRSLHRLPPAGQLTVCALAIALASALCYALSGFLNYRVVAFILLLVVSLIAVVFDIVPVLISALLTALTWNFFFIPPRFTLHVGDTEDRILLGMYFVVAVVSAVLTNRIRQMDKTAQEEESRAQTITLYNTLLNSLSHELRTPIAAIIGATDNLLQTAPRLSDHSRGELLREISKAALRLNQQVGNLLNMSRLESSAIQPHADWCDINETVYDLVQRIERDGKVQHKIGVHINPDLPLFRLDAGMLEQVLYNLVNNALTYTPPGSRIDVSAQCHADVLVISVEDNGPGFPKEEQERAFDKFYRLHATTPGGTGLGLSIVRGFTEAMGGRVELTTGKDGGALFTVRIAAPTSYLKNLKHE